MNILTIFICISWILNLFRMDTREKRIPAIEGSHYDHLLIESSISEVDDMVDIDKGPANPEFNHQDIEKTNILSNISESTEKDVVDPKVSILMAYNDDDFSKDAIESFYHWLTQDVLIDIRLPMWLIILFALNCFLQIVIQLRKLLPTLRKIKLGMENSFKECNFNRNIDYQINQINPRTEIDYSEPEFYYPDGSKCVLRCQLIDETDDNNILY